MTPDEFETTIIRSNRKDLVFLMMNNGFLQNEMKCSSCNNHMALVNYTKAIDVVAWRCMQKTCLKYKFYKSVRTSSFFEQFRIELSLILRIVIKYGVRQSLYSIKSSLDCCANTVNSILTALKIKIPKPNFSKNKLGGPGTVIEIDETMLNFKVKSHRGRAPINKTDALCIVECKNDIERVFACTIPNKLESTLVPLICTNVASNSTIWTDEHKSYCNLKNYNFTHGTVCHKYEFVNKVTGVSTQRVESFNNELKLEIKRRKGILTQCRESFLTEFCYYYNNRSNFFEAVLFLIKVAK